MKFKVPFYSNTPDDTHCFQATLLMVLKYFMPNEEYSWEELDQATAKKEGLWTWPLAGMLELQRMGFDVVHIEMFDYMLFAKQGDDYLHEFYGKEIAQAQIKHSDIQQEQRFAKEFIRKINFEKRIPDIGDIEKLMKRGFLIICNVNTCKLNQRDGYAGHFVVVTDYSDNELTLHDPGLPSIEDRIVSRDIFEQAWQYPDETAKNVTAFKYSP